MQIVIWRKLDLSEIRNLIVSKSIFKSQLGYLLSMMACHENLVKEIKTDIDRFIFRTGKDPWMAESRRYLQTLLATK